MKKTNPAGLCVHVCVFETLCNTPLRTSVCVCVCVSETRSDRLVFLYSLFFDIVSL